MRNFAWFLMLLCGFAVGCNQPPEETIPAVAPESSATTGSGTTAGEMDSAEDHSDHDHGEGDHDHAEGDHDHGDEAAEDTAEGNEGEEEAAEEGAAEEDSAGVDSSSEIRFVADKKIKVPNMMCPFSCWPKVKDALAKQSGVEGVQLAEQAKEGEIDNPVVELKLSEGFDESKAIAAIAESGFDGAEVVN